MATRVGPGRYRTQVLIDKEHRKYKSFYAPTARAADRAAEEYKEARQQAKKTGPSFGTALSHFIALRGPAMSPATVRTYKSIERVLSDSGAFYGRPLSSITSDDLQELVSDMVAKKRTEKTIRNYIGLINTVISSNGLPRLPVKLPERRRPSLTIPGENDLQGLFSLVRGTQMELPVLLGSMGLRRSEICGLSSADLSGDVLHVHRAIVYDEHQTPTGKGPKTGASDRHILLPHQIAELLREKGRVDLSPQQVTQRFRRLVKKAGLPHFRFHDLRHSFVSIAHAAGIPDAYIQSAGGWSTDYTMRNVYRQTLPDAQRQYADQMTGLIDRLL